MRQSIKKAALAVVIVSLLIIAPATAGAATSSSFQIKESIASCPFGTAVKPSLKKRYLALYRRAEARFSAWSPGRNIVCRGVKTRHGAKPAPQKLVVRSVHLMHYKLYPTQVVVAPVGEVGPDISSPVVSSVGGGSLSAIANCESGGNPGAISPDGQYRGKYQFDYGTWASVGGSGDPAAASEAEQDQRAAQLYAQRGAAPWPVCGQ